MKVAFVIGPYRSDTHYGIKKNIQRADNLAAKLWALGYAVHCPHTNTAFYSGIVREENFLEGGREILKRCDLAVAVDGWENSQGSIDEKKVCEEQNIPFYPSLEKLTEAVNSGKETI